MKMSNFALALAATAFAASASLGVAFAQQAATVAETGGSGTIAVWDAMFPGTTGTCRALDIHVIRNGSMITGTAAEGDMLDISRVRGTSDSNEVFAITVAPSQEKGPTGTIAGSVDAKAQMVSATLTGFGCHDGTVKVRFSGPTVPYSGG